MALHATRANPWGLISGGRHVDHKVLLTAVWIGTGTALYLLKPALAPFFLPLALIAPLLWSPRDPAFRHGLLTMSVLSGLLALTSVYLLINATWSLEPQRAFIAAIIFILLSLVLHVVIRTLPNLPYKALRAMAVGFYLGCAVGALLLSIEVAFGHPLHLYFFRAFPALAPLDRAIVMRGNIVEQLPPFFLNVHIGKLAPLVWPALLIGWHMTGSRLARAILLACLLPVIPAVFLSGHDTSKIAFIGGAATLLLARLVPRATNAFILTAWLVACTAALPLATWSYDMELYRAEWLKPSLRHRIVIWGTTSQRAGDAVLFGHGLVAARQIGLQQAEHPVYAPGTAFPLSVGPFPHNSYLEVWFDTGVCGAVLLLLIGLSILRAISRLPANVQSVFYAMYATIALQAASDFSIWSRPFLSSFGINGILAVLAWRFAMSAPESEFPANKDGLAENAERHPYSADRARAEA